MWGTRLVLNLTLDDTRFIPTHVGNSCGGNVPWCGHSVHPHACGELFGNEDKGGDLTGSSPRMWGTLPPVFPWVGLHRFIPTHVGNSTGVCHGNRSNPVHPHACGELGMARMSRSGRAGSSPRMWGTHKFIIKCVLITRFIPTHVGNSKPFSNSVSFASVHPHACGELSRRRITMNYLHGSSPRMWGTPTPADCED